MRNNKNQKSDSCSVYFTSPSWICCRERDCSCSSLCTCVQQAAEKGSETGMVRVREGGRDVDAGGTIEWRKVT